MRTTDATNVHERQTCGVAGSLLSLHRWGGRVVGLRLRRLPSSRASVRAPENETSHDGAGPSRCFAELAVTVRLEREGKQAQPREDCDPGIAPRPVCGDLR